MCNVGKAPGAFKFWLGQDTGREPTSCAVGGRTP